MNYEQPELIYVGTAAETILGIFAWGYDVDGQTFPEPMEFADDPQMEA